MKTKMKETSATKRIIYSSPGNLTFRLYPWKWFILSCWTDRWQLYRSVIFIPNSDPESTLEVHPADELFEGNIQFAFFQSTQARSSSVHPLRKLHFSRTRSDRHLDPGEMMGRIPPVSVNPYPSILQMYSTNIECFIEAFKPCPTERLF